ncbi:hypothetical protein [Pseudonocardia spinosispora]|uniref:hypothetical protein n=1 Tax=Pseudonocardia spinosispora TaxID=103441 RepID=UPI0004017865|nr:hypothetical protein [Pseudonocardia spinosispora]
MTETQAPTAVRQLSTPESTELAGWASVFEDLQFVLKCCEELVNRRATEDDVVGHALWSGALIAYVRCFGSGRLTEKDLSETGLQGEVVQWHKMLHELREHLTSATTNPRERFVIGAAQDADGRAEGIAIVSTPLPAVEELAVRQTGRLALELSTLVEKRMDKAQRATFQSARAMTPRLLNALPLVSVEAAYPEGAPRA